MTPALTATLPPLALFQPTPDYPLDNSSDLPSAREAGAYLLTFKWRFRSFVITIAITITIIHNY